MKKKFVVFVSSTYVDLVDERQAVSKALLRTDCFPSQMENWPAMDAEQMQAIRQLIDECDYYLVLSAGMYGSLDPSTGLSYTELEFDYALSIGKPIIRLLHKDPFNQLRGAQIEDDAEKKKKLLDFRKKLKTGAVCSFWTSPDDLTVETILAIKDIILRHPTDGWVRSDTGAIAQEQQRELTLVNELVKSIRKQDMDLGATLKDLPVPVVQMDSKGIVVSFNTFASDLIGKQLEIGSSFLELAVAIGATGENWFEERLRKGAMQETETLLLDRDDRQVFFQVTLNQIKEHGKASVIAVLNDITGLKSLEAQFVQSQKMQAIGQLAGGVAHDFNNLLTAISGHTDLMLLRHEPKDENYSDLMQIHQTSNRATGLVSQLLAFSRKQILNSEPLNLRETVTDLVHLLNRLIGARVRLTINHKDELPDILADKRQLEQVIMNLVVNARDAMPNGGDIHIETQVSHFDTEITKQNVNIPAGKYVEVRVSDTGVGIPSDQLLQVFEPFFTTKPVGEGTGLGLSTVYGIIKQSRGFILVESQVGFGTTFTLYFPVLKDEPKAEEDLQRGSIVQDLAGQGKCILIVEHEDAVRNVMRKALSIYGYRAIERASGEDALDVLSDEKLSVDGVISSAILTGLDGPAWVEKARKARPNLPVVFLSSHDQDKVSLEIAATKNAVFLSKPFSLSELLQTTANILEINQNQ